MKIPPVRGPLSRALTEHLLGTAAAPGALAALARRSAPDADALHDGDVQLALALCYELHYQGLDGVPAEAEWDLEVLGMRAVLERAVLEALDALVPYDSAVLEAVPAALERVVSEDDGPSVSSYLLREGTLEDFRTFVRQRSVYHLKEADPHTWVIPRLRGRPKAALVEIQSDEYGGGRPERMHAVMFAATMRRLGLDDTYGAYWPEALPETLASVNVSSYFGLHRQWRGAAAGHLAALEMSSTQPNRRYGNGLRRLGHGPETTAFYDEHVEADAVHEQVAAVDLCGALAAGEPWLAADIVWGAACCLAVDGLAGAALLQTVGALPVGG